MVHKLSTQIWRLEAIVNSFMLEQRPEMSRLFKAIKPVRKGAGDVRDVLGFPCIQIISERRA